MHWIRVPIDALDRLGRPRARAPSSRCRARPRRARARRRRARSGRAGSRRACRARRSRCSRAAGRRPRWPRWSSSVRTASADTPTSVVGESRPIVPLVGLALPVDRARRLDGGRRTGLGEDRQLAGSQRVDAERAERIAERGLGAGARRDPELVRAAPPSASVPTTKPPTTTTSSAAAEAAFPSVRLERRRAPRGARRRRVAGAPRAARPAARPPASGSVPRTPGTPAHADVCRATRRRSTSEIAPSSRSESSARVRSQSDGDIPVMLTWTMRRASG